MKPKILGLFIVISALNFASSTWAQAGSSNPVDGLEKMSQASQKQNQQTAQTLESASTVTTSSSASDANKSDAKSPGNFKTNAGWRRADPPFSRKKQD